MYEVTNRYGGHRRFGTLARARAYARAEIRDGWPTRIIRESDDALVPVNPDGRQDDARARAARAARAANGGAR